MYEHSGHANAPISHVSDKVAGVLNIDEIRTELLFGTYPFLKRIFNVVQDCTVAHRVSIKDELGWSSQV